MFEIFHVNFPRSHALHIFNYNLLLICLIYTFYVLKFLCISLNTELSVTSPKALCRYLLQIKYIIFILIFQHIFKNFIFENSFGVTRRVE